MVSHPHCSDEMVGEARIKLGPSTADDLSHGNLGRKPGAIWPGRGHGIIGIGQGASCLNEPALPTPEVLRLSRAILPFRGVEDRGNELSPHLRLTKDIGT